MRGDERRPGPSPARTPVSVQWRGTLPRVGSRAERREALAAELRAVLDRYPRVHVDWNSVSLSAQTVEALLDHEEHDATVASLEGQGLRVDRIVDQQIVP